MTTDTPGILSSPAPLHDVAAVIAAATVAPAAPKQPEAKDTPEALAAFLKEKGIDPQAGPGEPAKKQTDESVPHGTKDTPVDKPEAEDDQYESAVATLAELGLKHGALKKFSRDEAISVSKRMLKERAKLEAKIRAELSAAKEDTTETGEDAGPAAPTGLDVDLRDIEAEHGEKIAKVLKSLLDDKANQKKAMVERYNSDLESARQQLGSEYADFEDDDSFDKVRPHMPSICQQMAAEGKPLNQDTLKEALRRAAAAAGLKGIAPESKERTERLSTHVNGDGRQPTPIDTPRAERDWERLESEAFEAYARNDEAPLKAFVKLKEKAGRR